MTSQPPALFIKATTSSSNSKQYDALTVAPQKRGGIAAASWIIAVILSCSLAAATD